MIWILLASLACSALAMFLVVYSEGLHAHWSADHDLSGPQKMHVKAVPRVGGIGILAGVCGGLAAEAWMRGGLGWEILLMLACMVPL